MENSVKSIINDLLSNFNPENEWDQISHRRVITALGMHGHIDILRKIADVIKAPESCTHEELTNMYLEISRELLDSRIQFWKLKALTLVLDLKLSQFARVVQEELDPGDGDIISQQFSALFVKIGITPRHRIFDNPDNGEKSHLKSVK